MNESRYRQKCAVGRREPRGLLRYTDDEWAAIVEVAAMLGMRPGAWAQQAAHDVAVRQLRGIRPDRVSVEELLGELRQHRRVLTNIGGNVNQLARAANATGTIENPVAAWAVLRLVRNTVHRTEALIGRVRVELLP